MKKFFSLVLALVMALSLTTVAWGAGVACSAAAPCGHAAATGGLHYDSLQEAVDAAAVGGTVELLKDLTLTCTGTYGSIDITTGMDVVIKGNGHTITCDDGFYVEDGKLTLMSDLTVIATTYNAVYIRGGEVVTSAKLTANGDYSAIQGNGTYSGDVTVTGGTVSAPNVCAIYHPQNGKLTISGGTITGKTGVYVKSGELSITGGTIEGTGPQEDYAYKASGIVVTGDALVIENVGGSTGYEAVSSVSVTGGTFTSANAAAVASYAATTENPSAVAVDEFIEGGTFSGDVDEDLLADDVILSQTGAVVALPTSVIPAGGATLAPEFDDRTDAQYASWNAKVSVKKAENAKDKEFAIYTIEMIAKVDNAPIWWDSGVAEDKGDKEKFEFNGEREFVKVDADIAEFVIVEGKTITYFACADAINEKGWDEKVSAVTLPLIPNAQADWKCNTYYITDVADLATPFFWYEGELYAPAATTAMIFNVNGVAVGAAKVDVLDATRLDDVLIDNNQNADRVIYTSHNYIVEYNGNGYGAENVTKVYCDICKKSFDFAVGNELAAVAKFGEGKYFVLQRGLYVEKDTASSAVVRPSGSSSTNTTTGDKVESAATFDAGIAMYVGMSVLAATGSAVVIGKKKD